MKFAICNETFGSWPLERSVAFASECGYTGLEIAPFTLGPTAGAISPAMRQEIRRGVEDADLAVVGLHWLLAKTEGYHLTSPEASVRERTAKYLVELGHLCRDLGGQIMVFGSPPQRNLQEGVTQEAGGEYAREVFAAAMPALEDLEVVLALEPLAPVETNFLTTTAETVALIEQIGSPACRLHLDVKAMASEKESAADLIRRYADELVHFHANDPNLQGPGFGDEDFVPIFEALGEIDYRGWVSVEVFDYDPGVERLVKESREYMTRCLEKISGS